MVVKFRDATFLYLRRPVRRLLSNHPHRRCRRRPCRPGAPLAAAFRSSHPQISIVWVTEASGVLSQQIENGRPTMCFSLRTNRLSLPWPPPGRFCPPLSPATRRVAWMLWKDRKSHPFSDLSENWVRFIALPNPKLAPYGAAAVQALQHADLWSKLQNRIVYAENVRQALQIFESGNADAVITSASLLHGRHPDLLPNEWHQPIVQKAAVVASSVHLRDAAEFLETLKGLAVRQSSPALASDALRPNRFGIWCLRPK